VVDTDLPALREELGVQRISELKSFTLAVGAQQQELDEADVAEEGPRVALAGLIVAREGLAKETDGADKRNVKESKKQRQKQKRAEKKKEAAAKRADAGTFGDLSRPSNALLPEPEEPEEHLAPEPSSASDSITPASRVDVASRVELFAERISACLADWVEGKGGGSVRHRKMCCHRKSELNRPIKLNRRMQLMGLKQLCTLLHQKYKSSPCATVVALLLRSFDKHGTGCLRVAELNVVMIMLKGAEVNLGVELDSPKVSALAKSCAENEMPALREGFVRIAAFFTALLFPHDPETPSALADPKPSSLTPAEVRPPHQGRAVAPLNSGATRVGTAAVGGSAGRSTLVRALAQFLSNPENCETENGVYMVADFWNDFWSNSAACAGYDRPTGKTMAFLAKHGNWFHLTDFKHGQSSIGLTQRGSEWLFPSDGPEPTPSAPVDTKFPNTHAVPQVRDGAGGRHDHGEITIFDHGEITITKTPVEQAWKGGPEARPSSRTGLAGDLENFPELGAAVEKPAKPRSKARVVPTDVLPNQYAEFGVLIRRINNSANVGTLASLVAGEHVEYLSKSLHSWQPAVVVRVTETQFVIRYQDKICKVDRTSAEAETTLRLPSTDTEPIPTETPSQRSSSSASVKQKANLDGANTNRVTPEAGNSMVGRKQNTTSNATSKQTPVKNSAKLGEPQEKLAWEIEAEHIWRDQEARAEARMAVEVQRKLKLEEDSHSAGAKPRAQGPDDEAEDDDEPK
jgi:hypothetical protein